ncbi:MAG TPA: PQQ-dependent sugar dehydrogenase [Gaiellaceae bacterium]|nr:PQQ-dependent sugar dehydrogenase [Gaiellaceae bacterium]
MCRLLARSVLIGAASLVTVAALAGAASSESRATLNVRVDAREFSFRLSRTSAPAGSTLRFAVRNRGKKAHRFRIAAKRTKLLRPGASQTIAVNVPKRGTIRFLCTVANHAKRGMRGTFRITAAPPALPPEPPPPLDVAGSTALTRVGAFQRPVFVTAPPGDDRLFVVEQTGAVRTVRGGGVLPDPFLDLRQHVTASGESGLLSIAFAPDYARSGLLYAFYNSRFGPYGDIRIAEFRRSISDPDRVDASSERTLLAIPKPYENHNGGMLQFGPDGYLYASVGDGDPGALHSPGFFSQKRDVLLGSILRIDPRGGEPYAVPPDNPFVGVEGVLPEIWAYGLRNPWRFWIDYATGEMLIADVGSTSREEINLVRRGESGLNFGWPCFEGTLVFDDASTCDDAVAPLHEFPRADGVCAVIGGVVVHDRRIRALAGRYLYGDLCAGTVTAMAVSEAEIVQSDVLDVSVPGLSSFGVDGSGRVYVSSTRGDVYRLDPR